MSFKKGNAGRPVGSRNKKLELLRSNDEQLQRKVLDMALAGDISAIKIIADRIWPRLRAEAAGVSIDVVSNDLAKQGRSVIDAALHGKITVDAGRDLLAALFAQAKIIEAAEFEERLKVLEGHRDIGPWEFDHRPVLTGQKKLPMRGKRKRLTK